MRNRDKAAQFSLLDPAFTEWGDDIYDFMICHAGARATTYKLVQTIFKLMTYWLEAVFSICISAAAKAFL